MTIEPLGLNRITMRGGIVVLEIHDVKQGLWQYYLDNDLMLEFLFGTEQRFAVEDLQKLFVDGYFQP